MSDFLQLKIMLIFLILRLCMIWQFLTYNIDPNFVQGVRAFGIIFIPKHSAFRGITKMQKNQNYAIQFLDHSYDI